MASLKDIPILIVDDDEAASQFSATTLRKVGFKNIIESKDLLSAWKIVTRKRVGLVICEAMVGGKMGIRLLKKIRATGSMARLPVLFMSSNSSPKVIAAHMKAGASGFIVKPFDAPTLLENLKKAFTTKKVQKAKGTDPSDLVKQGYQELESYNADAAVTSFRKALKLNPKSAEAFKGLAYVCKKRRDMDQYQELLSAAAQSFIEAGQNSEAKHIFNELRQYNTDAPNPFTSLGEEALEAGKTAADDAVRMFTLAIGVEPDNPQNYLNLAQALKDSGREEEAAQKVNEALILNPELPEAKDFYQELSGEAWTGNSEAPHHVQDLTEEEQREAVRFWIPDMLLDFKGYKDHFAITEMSPISVSFNPLGESFKLAQKVSFKILKLEETGTTPVIKKLHGHVVRAQEEHVAVRLDEVSPKTQEAIHSIIETAQEQQKQQFREKNKEIKFEIDMLFM